MQTSIYRQSKANLWITLIALSWVFFSLLNGAPLPGGQPVPPPPARDQEPVIVKGIVLASFSGVPVTELFVFAYQSSGGSWAQIPWQFDEVADGVFTASGDGLLSDDDELVIMARDAGDQAPAGAWLDDADSRTHVRYELAVTDPLTASVAGYVYVYQSTGLTGTGSTDYVSADASGLLITTGTYIQGLLDEHLVCNRLEMNGNGQNVLDRTKVRLATAAGSTTEDALNFGQWFLVKDGPVRTIFTYSTNDGSMTFLTLFNYATNFKMNITADFSSFGLSTFNSFRFSADLTPAMAGGTYFDANTGAGVPCDGSPDVLTTTPASLWNQVSHPTLGTIIQTMDISSLTGTAQTYYKDNATTDPLDTGDGKSYSDCGVLVANAPANIVFPVWYYVLPAAQPSLGDSYSSFSLHPLQTTSVQQSYEDPYSPYDINHDNLVDQQDITALLNFLHGSAASVPSGGDVNHDGSTNAADLTRLLVKVKTGN